MGRILIALSELEFKNPGQQNFKIEQGFAEKYDNYGFLNISWEFSQCQQLNCSMINPSAIAPKNRQHVAEKSVNTKVSKRIPVPNAVCTPPFSSRFFFRLGPSCLRPSRLSPLHFLFFLFFGVKTPFISKCTFKMGRFISRRKEDSNLTILPRVFF